MENYSGMGPYCKFLCISPRLRKLSFLQGASPSDGCHFVQVLHCSNYLFHSYNCCFSQCDWPLYSVNGVFYFIYFNNGCFFHLNEIQLFSLNNERLWFPTLRIFANLKIAKIFFFLLSSKGHV